jgi:hypothetical protein
MSSARGGGVYNTGELTVLNSTIATNFAALDGQVGYGGGIFNDGTLLLANSTVHGNQAALRGGGVYAAGYSTVINHSTISLNASFHASGGVFVELPPVMHNSIIAGNSPADIFGSLAASDYNLVGNASGGSGFGPNDLLNVDPLLGPLQDNGGQTLTMELLPGSPAIDAGDPNPINPPEWDQRGLGFPRIINGTLDIGAFEVQASQTPLYSNALAVLLTADFDDEDIPERI